MKPYLAPGEWGPRRSKKPVLDDPPEPVVRLAPVVNAEARRASIESMVELARLSAELKLLQELEQL